jgi:hypothetical protein
MSRESAIFKNARAEPLGKQELPFWDYFEFGLAA